MLVVRASTFHGTRSRYVVEAQLRRFTSAPPAATSQTRRYFSISSIMNLPASAGSYSVETLHVSFASSKRLMRILRSIVGTQSLLVQSREANFAKRRSVGSEFVGDDYRRSEALTSKQFPQQPQRRGLVLGLDQDFENLAFAVDCAPRPLQLPIQKPAKSP
jgi:hypothetical protein